MSNVHIFENIGYQCSAKKDIVLKNVLANYQEFKAENVGAYVPYLIRHSGSKQYEVGIAQLKAGDTYYLVRDKVISSSSDGQPIDLDDGEFFIYANEYNFNTAFNNVIVKESDFVVDNVRSTYVVDTSLGNVKAKLPPAKDNESLIVDFKLVNNTLGKLDLYCGNKLLYTIQGAAGYASIASTGEDWVVLQQSSSSNKPKSFSSLNYSAQSDPGGEDGELQYKVDATTFSGANVYFGTDNKLLFGSNTASSANTILPTSGNVSHDTVFNQQYNNSGNFIINGTGIDRTFQFGSDGSIGVNMPSGITIPTNGDIVLYGNDSGNRNLFFAYDGRLGINIPTGSRPQTLAHFVNFACDETVRVENRAACHTADITLHHAPATQIIENGTDISTITFSSKDSTQSKHTYAKIFGKVLDYTNGSESGQLSLTVNSGNSLVNTFITNADSTLISNLNSQAAVDLQSKSLGLLGENIVFSGDNISFVSYTGSPDTTVNFTNAYVSDELSVDKLKTVNLASGSLLTVGSGGIVTAGNTSTNRFALGAGAGSGKVLTTVSGGFVATDLGIDDFFRTNNDILYSAYPKRSAEACLAQIIFDSDSPPTIEEFSVGDQIAIDYNDGITPILYTIVRSIISSDDGISIMTTADQITPNTQTNLLIHSISKGFTLTLKKYVDPTLTGVNDATAIVLSTRPSEKTIFNDALKSIGFTVNTDAAEPALDIRPSVLLGNAVTVGSFETYSTSQDDVPLRVSLTSGGVGSGPLYNTANYGYVAPGPWSGILSDVGTNGKPSSYGTFDQNGNAAEFISVDDIHYSTNNRYIAGGSVLTTGEKFNAFEVVNSTGVASGVGFRVASVYGQQDSAYISGALGLDFVTVGNPGNSSDTSSNIDVYDRATDSFSQASISNLGKVDKLYRIATTEVTNDQYSRFLNAVATGTDILGLYNSQMSSHDTGGILRDGSGPYTYSFKPFHSGKPVTFVSYMSSIRFTNWLHNGSPTGLTTDPANITESGAYNITQDGGSSFIIDPTALGKYFIPDMNEWYKAAYFEPEGSVSSPSNTVIINAFDPYPSAILTVRGLTHITGDLSVSGSISSMGLDVKSPEGNEIISLHNNADSDVAILEDATTGTDSLALVNSEHGRVTIGPNPTLEIGEVGHKFFGTHRTGFSKDKVTIASNGQIKILSSGAVMMSGLDVVTLTVNDLKVTDPEGNVTDFIAGTSGGLLIKDSSTRATGISEFKYIKEDRAIQFTGDTVSGLRPLYLNNLQYINTYDNLVYNDDNVEVKTLLKIEKNTDLQVGPDSESMKGSLLVHQGTGPLKFELNKYLEAEGLTYDRLPKRLVSVDTVTKRIKFVDPLPDVGGIAESLPTLEELENEYSFGDTVAVMHTGDFQVDYVKLAKSLLGPFDGPDALYINHPPLFEEDSNEDIFSHACPPLKANEADVGGTEAGSFTGIMYSITKAATLTNGLGYGLFQQDPPAVSGFTCESTDLLEKGEGQFTFRPSSKNVLSTRPLQHTHFNAVGENIDFAIYGQTKTLYNKYVPSLHDADAQNGNLPLGLVPVFKVDANIGNAASGTATGIFNSGYTDAQNTIPTGFFLEGMGKATVNTHTPYVITSISKAIDVEPSGFSTLDYLADLSVNQYTYSSGIITDHIYLSGMHGTDYTPGATLTTDVTGKIISLVPDLPPSVPGPPRNVFGIAGNGSVFLQWSVPTDDGRSPIIDYIVEYSLNDGEVWNKVEDTVSADNSLVVTGLVNDLRYIFRVAAVNSIGTGQVSLSSDGVTPTSNVPSAVTTLDLVRTNLTSTDDRITVNWTAPANAGASAITNYVIKYKKSNEDSFIASRTLNIPISSLTPVDGLYSYDLQESGYITTGPHILVQIFATNNSGNGTITEKLSLGTDEAPEPPQPPPDKYDFGETEFTGTCTPSTT